MFIWGLITPIVLLTEVATGRVTSEGFGIGDCEDLEDGFDCYGDISRLWGPYSPYFAVDGHESTELGDDCKVTFVQLLSRHGARYPTKGSGEQLRAVVTRIQQDAKDFSRDAEFLKNFQYELGSDDLTEFGQQEMYASGLKFFLRYEELAKDSDPFIRVSGQKRVVDSGSFFTRGFNDGRKKRGKPILPWNPLTIPEGETWNNTLDHGICRKYEEGPSTEIGPQAQAEFAATFTGELIEKLSVDIQGIELTPKDAIALMTMCPFHTVASPSATTLSPFCRMFNESDFENFDYYQSLGKYYGYGPGNPLGPAQGIGFVNELIARLTKSIVNDTTSTNHTLDSNPATFPVDKDIYLDFSHDNTMVGILSSLNLFKNLPPLKNNTRSIDPLGRSFSASKLVPFASRMYVEKLKCESHEEELVRVIVNDRLMNLQGCDEAAYGACKLHEFVESLKWARDGGNWNECE
ncbi:hypothetical protein ABW19_dt0207978 [Dactylella cylindrospora]|nr:hypothetical protein ABW19_dt0207978 [Dactylella cylindrospora]